MFLFVKKPPILGAFLRVYYSVVEGIREMGRGGLCLYSVDAEYILPSGINI